MEYEYLILLVMSILAVLISISVSLLTILKKLEPRSSTFSQAGCAIAFYVLIILDCCIICLCIHTFNITYNHYSYDMSTTIRDTIAVLQNAETALDTAAEFELSADDKTIAELDFFVYNLKATSGIETLYGSHGEFNRVVSQSMQDLNNFQKFVSRVAKVLIKECGTDTELKDFDLVELLLNFDKERAKFMLVMENSKSKFGKIRKLLLLEVEKQKRSIMEKSKVYHLLITMKNLLNSYTGEIDNCEATKKIFLDRMTWQFPDKEKIIKAVIRCASFSFVFTGSLSLLGFCRFFENYSSFAMKSSILLSALFAIVVNLFIISILVDLMGTANCPLEDGNFGLKNFTAAHENQVGCISSKDTFFSFLKRATLSSSDTIKDLFNVDVYKAKIMTIVEGSMGLINYPDQMDDVLIGLKNVSKRLNELEICLENQDKDEAKNIKTH